MWRLSKTTCIPNIAPWGAQSRGPINSIPNITTPFTTTIPPLSFSPLPPSSRPGTVLVAGTMVASHPLPPPSSQSNQHCPDQLSAAMEMFYMCVLSNVVARSRVWHLSTTNMTDVTEEWNLKFYLILMS